MASDPNLDPNVSSCYVAFGRRYTVRSNDSLVVYEGGALVTVHNSALEQFVQDGILLPPGAPYNGPTPGVTPAAPAYGASKRTFTSTAFPTRKLVTLTPTAGSKVLALPDTPSDPSSIVITVNERAYVNNGGNGGFSVSGQIVTMNFPLHAADVVTAEYR